MSRWSDDNEPRKAAPIPPQSIARVQPMVPEVSLFLHSQHESFLTKYSYLPSSVPSKKEISKEEPSTTTTKDETVLEMLQMQSEQLNTLQDQVQRLLSMQSSETKQLHDSSTQTSTGVVDTTDIGVNTTNASLDDMALGESVSMYSDDNTTEKSDEYEQILNQVQNLLRPSPPPRSKESRRDSVEATMDRVRQIGISFIRPEDLKADQDEDPRNDPLNSLYRLPPIESPLKKTSTSDASLIINTAALKYLNDSQLSKMMTNTTTKETYGLPDSHLSMATKNFLRHHRLVENDGEKKREKQILDNISTILNRPKLL